MKRASKKKGSPSSRKLLHEVRVNNRQELDDWLRSNIPPDQAKGWVRVICPDKTAKGSTLVSELKASGWQFSIREWDWDSEDDPRGMCYSLNCYLTAVLGCLEVLEENEAFAKEKAFQMAMKQAKAAMPMMRKLYAKLLETASSSDCSAPRMR
jgi:hypothetical protein